MITKKAFMVARWEFIERVKTKGFIIGIILSPLIMSVFFAAPAALDSMLSNEKPTTILLYDETGLLADSVRTRIESNRDLPGDAPKLELSILKAGNADEARTIVDKRILADEIDAGVIIPSTVFDSLTADYRSRNVSTFKVQITLQQAITDIVFGIKLQRAGFDPEKVRELDQDAELRTVRVTESGGEESGFLESFGVAYVFLLMLMIMILTSGQMLVRSMLEEKNNRIVEILVSSCSPNDLMFGKIIGLAMLGIVQVGVFALFAVVFAVSSGAQNLPLENLWLMILFVLMGFLFYASIFVTFGSLVSTEQEAAQMTGYLSLFLSLPLVVSFIAMQSPNNPVLVWVSMIPFLTPSMMILRLSVLSPPVWELITAMLILVGSSAGMVWVAAKVFRIGILLTGKRPSLREVFRWIRA